MTYGVPLAAIFFAISLAAHAGSKAPIPIADVQRTAPVNFEADVLPFLSDNCFACHCQTTTKGGLNLESRELMLKGGDTGPAIVPKQGSESLLLQAAAHLDDDLAMPPRDNKAKAKDLTPEQLGLLKLWIDQGAKISPKAERVVQWQPLAESLKSIFAVAVTADGQFAACTRENRICVYHLPSGQCVMNETAHRDQVNALAFNPDGTLMASGGYREVKLWRRARDVRKLTLPDAGTVSTVSSDGRLLAAVSADGSVKIWSLPDGKLVRSIHAQSAGESERRGDAGPAVLESDVAKTTSAAPGIIAMKFSPDGSRLACATSDRTLSIINAVDGASLASATESVFRPPTSDLRPLPSALRPLPPIAALAWMPDSKQLITGSADTVVRLWSEKFDLVKEFKGHTGPATAVQAIDINRLLSGSADGTFRIWETGKDQPVAQMNHGSVIIAIGARSDGQRFASAGADKTVKLWAADGKLVAELRGNRYTREAIEASDRAVQIAGGTLAFRKEAADAAQKQLVSAQDRVKKSSDAVAPKLQEFEAKQKSLSDATEAKKSAEQALAAAETELKNADEKLAAAEAAVQRAKTALDALKAVKPPAAASDPPAKPPSEGTSPEQTEAAKTAAVREAADRAAAEKARLSKAVADVASKAQDATKAKADRTQCEARRKGAADKIAPVGTKLLAAEDALEKARIACGLADTDLASAKSEEQKITASLAEAKTAVSVAEALRARAGEALQAAQKAAGDAEQPIRAIAFSSDNKTLATAGGDQCIHTWSAETGAPFEVIKGHAAPISRLAFCGADDLASVARDGSAIVWSLKPEWKLEGAIGASEGKSPLTNRVNALAFSRDGKLLATGSGEPSRGGEIKLWNPADGSLVRDFPNIHSDAIFGLEFSPDDKFLASGAADKMARVVDLATGKVVRSFEGHSHHVLSVAWSMDGRTLATAGADNMVKVWDFTTGDRKKNIEGYDKEVTAVRFAGASSNLLTSSGDNKVRLVALDGKEIRAFPEVADFMQSAAVSADGRIIVAGGQDGILRVWNGESGAKIATFPPPNP